jgi:hypothetical protein
MQSFKFKDSKSQGLRGDNIFVLSAGQESEFTSKIKNPTLTAEYAVKGGAPEG